MEERELAIWKGICDTLCEPIQNKRLWKPECEAEYSCSNYQFDVYKDNNLVVSKDDGYMTYEQACEAAIKYCLENLI